jgi:hypothetical protein
MSAWQVLTETSTVGLWACAPDAGRAGIILVGLAFMIMGLLIAVYVIPEA